MEPFRFGDMLARDPRRPANGRVAESHTQPPVPFPGPIMEPERVMTRVCSRGNVSDCTWRKRRRARVVSVWDRGKVWNWAGYNRTTVEYRRVIGLRERRAEREKQPWWRKTSRCR